MLNLIRARGFCIWNLVQWSVQFIFLLLETSGSETILDIRFCEKVFYRLGKTNAFIYKLHFSLLMIFYV